VERTASSEAQWSAWRPSYPYTVGIEEEVMLLEPDTWTLSERADEVLSATADELVGRRAAETHEAALELKTGPHGSVHDAVAELRELRHRLADDVAPLGIAAAAAGMHPARSRALPKVSPSSRYQIIERTMRGLAHREPTFALHIHVGVADAESAIRLLNRLRTHLPVMLALSASSPFMRGEWTGLASNRTVVFQGFPRTGLPRRFDSYADWVTTVDVLVRSRAIPEPTFLWWDVRPQPRLGTVEVRIMDSQPRLSATAALCALVQSVARLELEEEFAAPELIASQEALAENRFLAVRDGARAQMIDPVDGVRVPVAEIASELLAAARPHAEALDAVAELDLVPALVQAPEATRQRAVAAALGIPGLVADLAERFTRD
jgi:glutamate---cysteine ligase / carboxylate-amine ligase